jgi:hypothetical protein
LEALLVKGILWRLNGLHNTQHKPQKSGG